MKFLKWALILLFCVGGFAFWSLNQYKQAPLPLSAYRIFTVSDKDTLRSIARDLEEKEVISSAEEFVFWARLLGHDKKMKSGEYGIPVGTTMSRLFEILMSGKSLGHRIVVPEGTNLYEIAQRLESIGLCKRDDFIRVATDKKLIQYLIGESIPSLEGYLFPDTYFFTKVDGCKSIARRMVDRFNQKFTKVGGLPGWRRHAIVTLASIIEKETGAGFERPQISSVFHNRLKKKMRLQTDPTVIYARLLTTGSYRLNITKTDLQTDHPYNTYRRGGLPPGPISNPGLEALRAAVKPAQTDYLYFVSRNDGTHVFSKTYKEHSSAVTSYQMDPRARAGKSWRDLNKRGVNSEGDFDLSIDENQPQFKEDQ